MNRDQAYDLVRQTFTQAFDKNRFLNFSKNLLNRFDESKASVWSNQRVKDAFKDHVQHYERLGTYETPEKEKMDVLIVHLTKESKLERARTAIRNFVADHLKTRNEKDAALVAFVSPTEKQWRFSYVKMEYATVEKESLPDRQAGGKVGVEARLTPARRFSYIVGEGESCHTAQTRFLDLLKDTETDPSLADIEEAFSVEAVTKEFFTKYAELFEQINKALTKLVEKDKALREEFNEKNVNTVDFAKKLMGQIVFLYFLQKKGWLGVEKGKDWGTGPRDFLRRLANGEYGNFFNDVLEPLFYDTLATDRGHEAWDKRFNCRIPFLNGGLFEPFGDYDWRKTDIAIPNKLFTNNEFVEEGLHGTGVLDVFDRYNFTVNEAEPLEKEVAIDPEMLGKVYENLIEENRRKGLGARYTPREIVHNMCQESLINYLDTAVNKDKRRVFRSDIETFVHFGEQISHYEQVETKYAVKMPKSIEQNARFIDEKLAEITVCDIAVGSGAFPVGMMIEIVRCRAALTVYFNDVHERTPYHFKRHAIQNCLYGVDIDPGAVEIAKLRLWLSLVVDEEETRQIKPLPNLDYKIMQGNSLIEEYEGIRLFDEGIVKAAPTEVIEHFQLVKKRINNLQQEYIELHSANKLSKIKKGELKDQVRDQQALLKRLLKEQGISQEHDDLFDALSVAKKKWIELKQKQKDFFEASEKSVKDDLRKRISELEWDLIRSTLEEEGKSDTISHIEEHVRMKTRPFFLWKLYFAEVFELKNGFDVVIANPPYVFARESEKKGLKDEDKRYFYKHYELAEYQVNLYPLFVERGTRLLSARGCLCFITPNNWLTINTNKAMRKFVLRQSDITIVNFYSRVFESAAVDSSIIVFRKSDENQRVRLFEYTDSFRFIKEADCSFFLKQREHVINVEAFKAGDTGELMQKIDGRSVPLSMFADVKAGLMAYETGCGTPPQTDKMKKNRVYHSTQKLDKTYLKYLDGKDVCRYHLGWSGEYLKYGDNLAAPRKDFRLYSTMRILVRQIPAKPPHCVHACLTDEVALNDRNSMNVINIREKPEYVLGVLNSRLVSWWFVHKFGKMQRETFPQFKVNELADFCLPNNGEKHRNEIARLAGQILSTKKRDPLEDTTALEREIDQLVYKLYELTEEEIGIVEGNRDS